MARANGDDGRRDRPRHQWVDMKFTITPALKAALKERSAEEGVSTQAFVRRILSSAVGDGGREGAA